MTILIQPEVELQNSKFTSITIQGTQLPQADEYFARRFSFVIFFGDLMDLVDHKKTANKL